MLNKCDAKARLNLCVFRTVSCFGVCAWKPEKLLCISNLRSGEVNSSIKLPLAEKRHKLVSPAKHRFLRVLLRYAV